MPAGLVITSSAEWVVVGSWGCGDTGGGPKDNLAILKGAGGDAGNPAGSSSHRAHFSLRTGL